MSAVFRLPADATQTNTDRFVLLALADNANDEGVCWPSQERIAGKCGIAPETARHCLARLTERGWLTKARAEREGGRLGGNRYTLAIHRLLGDGGDDHHRPLGDGATVRSETVDHRPPGDGLEPSVEEPSGEPSTPPTPATVAHDTFEAWWAAYPRKVGKPNARRAWLAALRRLRNDQVRTTDAAVEIIRDGFRRWRRYWIDAATPEDLIPHPSTWLNQDRFHDAPPAIRPRTVGHAAAVALDELAEA